MMPEQLQSVNIVQNEPRVSNNGTEGLDERGS